MYLDIYYTIESGREYNLYNGRTSLTRALQAGPLSITWLRTKSCICQAAILISSPKATHDRPLFLVQIHMYIYICILINVYRYTLYHIYYFSSDSIEECGGK